MYYLKLKEKVNSDKKIVQLLFVKTFEH